MGFNEYKIFSRAAKDVGINDKDERKLIAMDSNMLLEESSPEFKKQIGPKTLQGFFNFLNDGQSDDSKDAVRLGNLLYQYRSDERAEKNFAARDEREPRVLNDQDRRIINLGCRLIEDSFYNNKLVYLDGKSSAAAAFIFNNLAKVLQSQENLSGFNKEKFTDFIEKVSQFETESLFEKYAQPEAVDKKISGQEKLDQLISQESSVLEGFMQQDWSKYHYELVDRLKEAVRVLDRVNYLGVVPSDFFHKEIGDISWFWSSIIEHANHYAKRLLANKTGGILDPKPLDNQFKNTTVSLFSLKLKLSGGGDWSPTRLEAELEKLRKKLKPESTNKSQKYNDLSSFGLAESKRLAPDAIKTFEEAFENRGQGLFNQYILQIKKVEDLKEQRRRIISQDESFQTSRNQIMQKLNNPSTIPYFLKSYIIAWDLQSKTYDKAMSFKSLGGASNNKAGEHLFFGEYGLGAEGELTRSGPNYANVHYLPGDMSLAVWAAEYSESLIHARNQVPDNRK